MWTADDQVRSMSSGVSFHVPPMCFSGAVVSTVLVAILTALEALVWTNSNKQSPLLFLIALALFLLSDRTLEESLDDFLILTRPRVAHPLFTIFLFSSFLGKGGAAGM